MKKNIIFFLFCIITHFVSSQDFKKIDFEYNVSVWIEKNNDYDERNRFLYLNNNSRISFPIFPFVNVGLSVNHHYNRYKAYIPYIYTPERRFYDIWTTSVTEFCAGPFIKIIYDKKITFFLSIDYNLGNGRNTFTSFNEYKNSTSNGNDSFFEQYFIYQIGLGKKLNDSFSLNCFFQKRHIFYYKYKSTDSDNHKVSIYQNYIGIGAIYHFNFKNNTK